MAIVWNKNLTREEKLQYHKENNKKNKVKKSLQNKVWYEEHKEEKLIYSNEYKKKNKDQCSINRKRYYYANFQKEKEYNRKYQLIKNYGMSISDYNLMFEEQSGKCYICQKHQSECKKPLAVDHNHKTGKIRKLLCMSCNAAIGMVRESTDILKNMVIYLELENRNE